MSESETIACPSCGTRNPAEAVACAQCNFPLRNDPAAVDAAADAAASATVMREPTPQEAEATATTSEDPEVAATETSASGFDPGPRPVRRARPRPAAMQPIQVQIWLFAGAAIVLGIVYFAAQGFWTSNAVPVAGARPEQQQRADLARQVLERDSTNLEARIELANVLYDTGNWTEAIVHYRSAERLDPKRSTTIVDLGVCYYNLGQFAAADSLFHRALDLDSHQVFALFNLGIVAESRERWDEALGYFHRALQSGPPDAMKPPLQEHLQAVMAKAGKKPPPLKP
jgi:tetratricopeptide (TPR) repeat protein